VGPDAGGAGRWWRQRRNPDGRQHLDPGTPPCRRRKGGTQNQALGRSRGGLTTKIHARTNAEGLPIALILSPGEAHDCTAFVRAPEGNGCAERFIRTLKDYDTDDIRGELRTRGVTPEIPTKRNRKLQYTVNRAVYATRNRIERFFNRLKESRRVATRYDHTAESFLGFAKLAAIKIWIRFVHAT